MARVPHEADQSQPSPHPIIAPDDPDHVVIERVVAYYAATLKQDPEALAYLQRRGLTHPELLDTFKVGFSDRTLGLRIPKVNRRAGWALRSQLQRLGILRPNGHEHFRGAVTVPVLDPDGHIVTVYGRLTTRSPKGGARPHLFAPDPPRGVFNRHALTSRDVILTRSVIDAITLWCAELRNVTCAWGLDGFTDEHLDTFIDHGVERVLIAYPRTDAGDAAAEKLADVLSARGMQCFRVAFPRDMDANDYACAPESVERGLDVLVRNATWLAGTRPAPVPATLTPTTEATPSAPPFLTPPATPEVAEEHEHEVVLRFGDRRWRIRGLEKNTSFERLKVNVLASREHPEVTGFHVDTLELYAARQRAVFIREAALELSLEERIVKADLAKVLLELERLQEEHIRRTLDPKNREVVLTDVERDAALALLRDPNLVDRILDDYEKCGLVGERDNVLVGYLAAVSRKLDEPLAVVVQSSSAAGKSSLLQATLRFIPDEERLTYSAMTDRVLFYLASVGLRHKVLAISEQEGAASASYPLKLLQSEGSLTIASTGKDPHTGRHVANEYRVEGPVAVMMTTTAVEVDEELMNRCIVLTVDERREQTRAIHERQRHRETLEGLRERHERERIVKLHQNAQRLLRPMLVVNPHAPGLRFGPAGIRARRDFPKYLGLQRAIALLHQHQRPVKTIDDEGSEVSFIEVTESDIALADRLLGGVLRNDLDELPPQTRRLYGLVVDLVRERAERDGVEPVDVRFTRRELRERTGLGNTQVKLHLRRLVDVEYVGMHTGGTSRRVTYSLTEPCTYDAERSGSEGHRPGGGRPSVGPESRRRFASDDAHIAPSVGGSEGGIDPARDEAASYRTTIVGPDSGVG